MARFVSMVLADTEDTWTEIFRQAGKRYEHPKLVLYSGAIGSACGLGQAAMGPFYCPADQKVYIDLAFYGDLKDRFRAPGDFAQAYVIAHEVGHHVQNLLGISTRCIGRWSARARPRRTNCRSGWNCRRTASPASGRTTPTGARQVLEQGDIEEGLNAASAIGDDRLQKQARGTVSPDSFTHGSSTQRVRWFRRGIESGDINQCNTFKAKLL